MDTFHKNLLSEFRQRIPVGVADGLRLLNITLGNVDEAIFLLQEEYIQFVSMLSGVTPEVAARYLVSHHFDTNKALRAIDEDQSKPAIGNTKDVSGRKEYQQAVFRTVDALKAHASWEHFDNRFTDIETISGLDEPALRVVVISEWLEYEAAEGLIFAMRFGFSTFIDCLSRFDCFQSLTAALRLYQDIYEEIRSRYRHLIYKDSYQVIQDEIMQDEWARAAADFYYAEVQRIPEVLFTFIRAQQLDL